MRLSSAEKRALVTKYINEGRTHISPTEAAPILDCVPYTINLTARRGGYPANAYRFHGRNCRINLHWLAGQINIPA